MTDCTGSSGKPQDLNLGPRGQVLEFGIILRSWAQELGRNLGIRSWFKAIQYVQQEQADSEIWSYLLQALEREGREQNDHEHQVLKGGDFEIYYNSKLFTFNEFTSRLREKDVQAGNNLTVKYEI